MERNDLQYDPTTFAGSVDLRVVVFLERYKGHQFDPSYLNHITAHHGGVPGKQYFEAVDGKTTVWDAFSHYWTRIQS